MDLQCGNGRKHGHLPFFPKYEFELLFKDKLRVTWFEPNFSQSQYCNKSKSCGSNACTLIVVLLTMKCHLDNIQMYDSDKCINPSLILALAESILNGNKLHNTLKEQGALSHPNLTVPEALLYCRAKYFNLKEWTSELYTQPLTLTLHKNLSKQFQEWISSDLRGKHRDLFVVLISNSRSVVFVMQPDLSTITLIDSHQHTNNKGAVVAVTQIAQMKCLCEWFGEIMCEYYQGSPEIYELSFLYFENN